MHEESNAMHENPQTFHTVAGDAEKALTSHLAARQADIASAQTADQNTASPALKVKSKDRKMAR